MECVIVVRSFPEPVTFEEVECREARAAHCLETNRVKPKHSYFSRDRRTMICVYEAPDAESVRVSQDQARLPYDRVFTATVYTPPGS